MSSVEQLSISGTEPASGPRPAARQKRNPAARPSEGTPVTGPAAGLPRIALSIDEAAAAIGVSRDHFERHVKPRIRMVYLGSRIIVPVKELEKWVDRQAVALAAPRRGSR